MSARQRGHRLMAFLAVGLAVCLSGCEPPQLPARGGLVSVGETETQSPSSFERAAPIPTATEMPDQSAFVPSSLDSPDTDAPLAVEATSPAAPSAPPAPSTPIVANPGLIPVDQIGKAGGQGQSPAAAGSRGQTGQTAAAAASGVPPIQLSAGIAVPQSLPTGTQMGMSVDYTIRGALNRSSRYVWVISSEAGEIEAEVELGTSGTLANFVPTLRPDDRPFNCRIDEITPGGRRVRASNVAPMQTNY